MGSRPAQFLLLLLVGWTLIGVGGVSLSLLRGDLGKAFKNVSWIAGVWLVYLTVLLSVSLFQPQKVLPAGTPQCFDNLCYTVVSTEAVPGYLTEESHLLRVRIAINNRGRKPQQEKHLRPFLVDSTGKRWNEVPGLSGIPLNTVVQPGQSLVSAPVFKLPNQASPFGLGLFHAKPYSGLLVIGDHESFLHRLTLSRLPS